MTSGRHSPPHRRPRWLLALLPAILIAPDLAAGADAPLKRFSVGDGLSQASVLAIQEDSRGFVWLGTEDGLNRFDGERFHVYRRDPGNPSSLPSGFIRALDEDSAGNIWVGTEGGGVARWDPRTDRFAHYRSGFASASPHLSSDYVQALLVDRAGYVWIGLRDKGLERLDPQSGAIIRYRHRPGDASTLTDNRVTALAESADGTLWIGTQAGVDRLTPADGRFERVIHGAVRSLLAANSGTLWIGHEDRGLSRFEPETGALSRYRNNPSDSSSLASDQIRALSEDAQGRLWVGTLAGLDCLEVSDAGIHHFVHVSRGGHVAASLGTAGILALHRDRSGALWIGTHLAGLARWDEARPAVAHLRVSASTGGDEPAGDIVTSFAQDRSGRVWIGTFGAGLARVDRATGRIDRFRHDPDVPGSLSGNRVMALLIDRAGRLWVGTKKGGLNRLNADGSFTAFRHLPDDPASLGANGIMTLFEDASGALWVGTFEGGLSRVDPASDRISTYRHDPNGDASLSSDRVTAIADAADGRLWVGTDGGGLDLFDPETSTATTFRHDPSDPSSLPADTVMALYRDADGDLWIGTRGGGLSRMTPGAGGGKPAFTTWTERHGLPNSAVYAIRPDESGGLWMSTNHGLSRFDPASGTFANFDVRHGLQGNEFNFGAAYRNAAGELFFGGLNGYNVFQPERLLRLAAASATPATRSAGVSATGGLERSANAGTPVRLLARTNGRR